MLTEKIGDARFRVKDTDSGREWLVYPEEYLTALQIERMAYRPDMIRATASIIADDMATWRCEAVRTWRFARTCS